MARPSLERNVKFKALVRALGIPKPYVRGILETLWDVANECGNPVLGKEPDVEYAAEWPGEPGVLFEALRSCRLIDEVSKGVWIIHDYWDHAPRYVKNRKYMEEKRKAASGVVHSGPQKATRGKKCAPPAPAPAPIQGGNPPETPGVVLPRELETSEFRAAWTEWMDYRRDRRLSSRPQTLQKQLAFLAALGSASAAVSSVEQSIRNGWQGLFPVKHSGSNGKPDGGLDAFKAKGRQPHDPP